MVLKYFLGVICLIGFYVANADDGHKCGCVVQGLPEYVCQEVKDIYHCEDTINLKKMYDGRNVLIYKGKYYINNFYPKFKELTKQQAKLTREIKTVL